MDNIGKMTEIDVKCSAVIEILSDVIQNYLIKESSDSEKIEQQILKGRTCEKSRPTNIKSHTERFVIPIG